MLSKKNNHLFISNIIRYALLFLLIAITGITVNAQNKTWNGKKSAVCLTYDDALNVHLDNVVPVLDSLGFTATFYIAGSFPGVQPRLEDWRAAAEKGNELGNHSIFHPCKGSLPDRDWVAPEYDLDTYTMRRAVEEIETMNTLLTAIDGKTKRTFASPCGETMIGDSSYLPLIKDKFVAVRGVGDPMQTIDGIDLYNIGCYMVDKESAGELIELVDEAIEKNALLVLLFHGVGGEHSINASSNVHNELLKYLKENEKDIWVAPLVEIAGFVKQAH